MRLYFRDVYKYFPDMLKGLGINIFLAIASMIIGSILGLLLYLGKDSKIKFVHGFCYWYIEVIRNTPLLVQLYLIYFGLAQLGLDVSAIISALIAMILNNAAYTAEIFRGGFLSVSHGTIEAGEALGMTPFQVFLHVRFLPALRTSFPALINQFIMLFLFSSVASIIALPELTYVAMNASSKTARTFEVYAITGILFYVVGVIFINVLRKIEQKLLRW